MNKIRLIDMEGSWDSPGTGIKVEFEDLTRGLHGNLHFTVDNLPSVIQEELNARKGKVFMVDGIEGRINHFFMRMAQPKTIKKFTESVFPGMEVSVELAFNCGFGNGNFYRVWVEPKQ